ncbi:hypothetical protein [Curvivirga aplysinae]|uniref:hypothetical protein n=1 Tax=Curvivirga aplysinae TaxID=2529852 RepID=UPI0012BB86A5|nr:hypothetical protein [Curvivirga aplysinae]MTI09684.1 hypothetical protein [Curvivirga aplysinae]
MKVILFSIISISAAIMSWQSFAETDLDRQIACERKVYGQGVDFITGVAYSAEQAQQIYSIYFGTYVLPNITDDLPPEEIVKLYKLPPDYPNHSSDIDRDKYFDIQLYHDARKQNLECLNATE